MKLSVLTENTASGYYAAEHGLSYFIKRYRKNDSFNIGLDLSYAELDKKNEIVTSRGPYYLSENIIFLGEIPRINSFEAQTTTFVDENRNDDFIMDDSALVIIVNEELVVVSGCAHSGICNIVEYAKKITGLEKIKAVIGGFHLMENNDQTKKTIKYFKGQNVSQVFPSHCTKFPALVAFYNEFKIQQVTTGMIFNY